MRWTTSWLLSLALFASVLGGCTTDPPMDPSPTPDPANSCATLAPPAPDIGEGEGPRGTNAFEYMVGLVCDHEASPPQERFRVPGTSGHDDGAAYLHAVLKGAGWTTRFQNFTGSEYEAIMINAQGSSYSNYMTSCSDSDRTRMRGLPFANIEARLPATGGIVLFMAHWDSKRFITGGTEPVLGANDGASGVGLLLELARVWAKEKPSWEMRILLTDGEDGFDDCHPLAGSTYYAENLPTAERARLRGLVLLDMVGDLEGRFFRGCGQDTALADRIWAVAARLDVRQFRNTQGCGVIDDHTAFEERGMKGVDVIDWRPGFPPYWHTADDTPDKISPEVLGAVGRVMYTVVKELPIAG